jgi:superfamily II DNA or RNA helicase
MITKLCSFEPRSEFILGVIENEMKLNNDQQIMVLAHNKSILSYLYDAIVDRDIAGCGKNVGYYLGGMKDVDLKTSESKKIIIATYAMASEGLDIPTLTTLIMATPKTDVCQSVGRILRTKHAHPLVIDFVDHHDIFKSQWMKRQAYYLKSGYRIMYTTNTKYAKNIWKVREKGKESTEEVAMTTTSTSTSTSTSTCTVNQIGNGTTARKKAASNKFTSMFAPFQHKSSTSQGCGINLQFQ